MYKHVKFNISRKENLILLFKYFLNNWLKKTFYECWKEL